MCVTGQAGFKMYIDESRAGGCKDNLEEQNTLEAHTQYLLLL